MRGRTELLGRLHHLSGRGITDLPGFDLLADRFEVLSVTETWHDDQVDLDVTVRPRRDAVIDLGGARLGLGTRADRPAAVPVRLTLPAAPVRALLAVWLLDAGLVDAGQVLAELEAASGGQPLPTEPDEFAGRLADLLSDQLALLVDTSLTVGPVGVRLDLSRRWFPPARLVRGTDGSVTDVEVDDQAPQASVIVGEATLTVSRHGIAASFEPSTQAGVDLPPVVLGDTGVGLRLRGLTVAADGAVTAAAVDLWRVERVLPGTTTPVHVAATDWTISADGITGSARATIVDPEPDDVEVTEVLLRFAGDWWPVQLTLTATVDAARLLGDPAPRRADRLEVVGDLTVDIGTGGRAPVWRTALTVVAADDGPLLTLTGARASGVAASATVLALATGAATDDPSPDADVALLAGLVSAGVAVGAVTVDAFHVDRIAGAFLHRGAGPELELGIGLRTDLTLHAGGQDVPLQLGVGDVHATWRPATSPPLEVDWALDTGLDVTVPVSVDVGGIATVDRIGIRAVDDGIALELGVEPTGTGDVAVAPVPDAIVVTYRPAAPAADRVTVEVGRPPTPVVLLVPGVLYASGYLDVGGSSPFAGWASVLSGELTAYLIGKDPPPTLAGWSEKDAWALDLSIGLLSATEADTGAQAFVLTVDAGFRPGLPLGTSGAALYGVGITFALNGEPDTPTDGDYASWFLESAPRYSTSATKWRPAVGSWAFGASATLGSAPDDGTSWNIATGLFLLLPGPTLLLTGSGNLFTAPQPLPAQGGDPEELSFGFGAVLTLDFGRRFFGLDLRGDIERTAGDATLLKATIPAGVSIDLDDPRSFELYVGRPDPIEERVEFDLLGLYTASSYLLLDGQDITLPGTDLPLPGTALAFGATGGLDKRLEAGPAKVVLAAQAGFDVGLSLSLPLAAGRVHVHGLLDASVFGVGLSIEARLALAAMAPDPFVLTGSAALEIGLPWPLPDFSASARLVLADRKDWLETGPDPADPVGQLTVWPAGSTAPTTVDAFTGDPAAVSTGVPIDAALTVSFDAPVGNDAVRLGSVVTDGHDAAAPVWQVATAADEDGRTIRHGFRYVVEEVEVVRDPEGAAEVLADQPARWPRGTAAGEVTGLTPADVERTDGGVLARTNLQLLDVLADPVAARIGDGVRRVERWSTWWDPCAEPAWDSPKLRRRRYTAESLSGLLRRRTVPPLLSPDPEPVAELPAVDGRLAELLESLRHGVIDVEPAGPPFVIDGRIGGRIGGTIGGAIRGRRDDGSDEESGEDVVARRRHPIDERILGPRRRLIDERILGTRRRLFDTDDDDPPSSEPSPDGPDGAERSADMAALRPVLRSRFAAPSVGPPRLLRFDADLVRDRLAAGGRLPRPWIEELITAPLPPDAANVLPNQIPPDEVTATQSVDPPAGDNDLLRRHLGARVTGAAVGRNPARYEPSRDPQLRAVEEHDLLVEADDPVFVLPLVEMEREVQSSQAIAETCRAATGTLRIELRDSADVHVRLLCAEGVVPFVWFHLRDGSTELQLPPAEQVSIGHVIEDPRTEAVKRVVPWQLHLAGTSGDVVAIEAAAARGPLRDEFSYGERAGTLATLTAVDVIPPADRTAAAHRDHRDATRAQVRTVADDRATWDGRPDPAGLLAPDTVHEVRVRGRWSAVTEDGGVLRGHDPGAGSRSGTFGRAYRFRTAATHPARLTPHPTWPSQDDVGTRLERWQVAARPGPGAAGHYTGDGLLLRLADTRTLGVAGAFGRQLQLRVTDDTGAVVERLGDAELRTAELLSADAEAVRARVRRSACLADAGELWHEARMTLGQLAPGRRHVAELRAVDPLGDAEPGVLWSWRFTTSHHPDAPTHLAAHVVVDELLVDPDRSLAGLGATLGSPVDVRDDQTLDTWLVDTLGVPPDGPPAGPTVSRLWSWHPGSDDAVLLGLLFDDVEPLLHGPQEALTLDGVATAATVSGSAGARTLLLAAHPVATGPLTVRLDRVSLDGSPESHTLDVPVPARPPAPGGTP